MKTKTIAEIGINYAYGTDKTKFIDNAMNLVRLAAMSGFDYVKFQKRNPDICIPESQKHVMKSVPWEKEPITYLQYKKDIELDIADYTMLYILAMDLGIGFFLSVWDIDSVNFAIELHDVTVGIEERPLIMKIPSALITDTALIKYARSAADILMLSTGMSTEREIEIAVAEGMPDVLFHTNSAYPSPLEGINLNYIKHLITKYGDKTSIGYSGHEFGLTATFAAAVIGAEYIERHITRDRTLWGSDQMASVEPIGQSKLIKGLKELEIAMGPDIINERIVHESELDKRKSLRGI
ncbi:MAG: N-acetylneuraminate synthase family protein [Candidatus Pacearchaeota archaeon]|jgi:N-acetylneuraminate synthase|nr:N-acetylneuraminate synthase family protein [Clostridia bacterium]